MQHVVDIGSIMCGAYDTWPCSMAVHAFRWEVFNLVREVVSEVVKFEIWTCHKGHRPWC